METPALFESSLSDDGILSVVLRGDLDSVSTPEFDRQIRSHLDAGHDRIIIDCRHLGYLSSLGIGSLVALQTRLHRRRGGGAAVKLAAIQGPVMKVLRLVKLDKILDIYGDTEFARQAFREEAAAAAK